MAQLVISRVTASTIPSASTFYVGSYDERIISGSVNTGLENGNGGGHTNLVSGLTGAENGRAWSVGYDNMIRDITANGIAWVHCHSVGAQSIFGSNTSIEQPDLRVNSQPKGVASADDKVYVVTANGVEVYAGGNVGKTVTFLPLKANLNCIAVHGKMVPRGGSMSIGPLPSGVLIIIVP